MSHLYTIALIACAAWACWELHRIADSIGEGPIRFEIGEGATVNDYRSKRG